MILRSNFPLKYLKTKYKIFKDIQHFCNLTYFETRVVPRRNTIEQIAPNMFNFTEGTRNMLIGTVILNLLGKHKISLLGKDN